jgi:hypothetical protein
MELIEFLHQTQAEVRAEIAQRLRGAGNLGGNGGGPNYPLSWEGKTICSPAPTPEASVPPLFIPLLARPN